MSSKIRQAISFTGRVQGVGFRYKVSHLANYLGVTGWVRNEYDGSVSAQLQGLPDEIDRIIQSLNQDRYIQIDEIYRKEIPLEEDERGFRVHY